MTEKPPEWNVKAFATKNDGVLVILEHWSGCRALFTWQLNGPNGFCDWVDWLVDQKAELIRKVAEGDCDGCREDK